MFRLDHGRRRGVLLLAFGLLCVVPTCIVVALAVMRQSPGAPAGEARRLCQSLQLPVEVRTVDYTRPGEVVLREVLLGETATEKPLLELPWVRIRRAPVWKRLFGEDEAVLRMSAPQARLRADRLADAHQWLDELVSGGSVAAGGRWQLDVDSVVLFDATATLELTDFHCAVRGDGTRDEAQVQFHAAAVESSSGDPVRVTIGTRRGDDAGPHRSLDVEMAGQAIAIRWLARLVGPLDGLGRDTSFVGEFSAERSGSAPWKGIVSGTLVDLDWGEVTSVAGVPEFSGTGRLHLYRATFEGPRWLSAQGHVEAGPGHIDAAWLKLLRQALHGEDEHLPAGQYPYFWAGTYFALDGAGVTLWPLGADPKTGEILDARMMVDQADRILVAYPRGTVARPVPYAAILNTMDQQATERVPMSPLVGELVRRLPMGSGNLPNR